MSVAFSTCCNAAVTAPKGEWWPRCGACGDETSIRLVPDAPVAERVPDLVRRRYRQEQAARAVLRPRTGDVTPLGRSLS